VVRRFCAAIALLVLAAGLTACSPAPATSSVPTIGPGSPSPTSEPSASPAVGAIDHETGATDVVLRFEEGGGFVPMGFFATEAPIFTLYGDGTVIFKDGFAAPPPADDGLIRVAPFQTVKLTEDQVQSLLQYAIAGGGLGVARRDYQSGGADLPTATFTVMAAGTKKTVSVMALGMDRTEGPDAQVLKALAGLGDKLRSFGPEVDGEAAWTPDRWRGVLTEDMGGNPPRPWPWADVAPAEWVQHQEPGAPGFPVRQMSTSEIDLLNLTGIDGGFSGMTLTGPDGKQYFFALRPLLPDEAY
ncbi:MAG: hypothetical protein ABIV26_09395, partial [Candidatus Limnocylindrales bacterium]